MNDSEQNSRLTENLKLALKILTKRRGGLRLIKAKIDEIVLKDKLSEKDINFLVTIDQYGGRYLFPDELLSALQLQDYDNEIYPLPPQMITDLKSNGFIFDNDGKMRFNNGYCISAKKLLEIKGKYLG